MIRRAMSPFQAVVLAVVQGVTEFLPISSSAHLILVPYFLGWPDQGLSFDIAVHAGTLVAILAYFHRDVRDLVVGFFTGRPAAAEEYDPRRLAWAILLGTVPAGLAGLVFKDTIATVARSPLLIAGTSIGYGLLLAWADRAGRRERDLREIGLREALIIGAAQALALVPGTSRSGITMTAGPAARLHPSGRGALLVPARHPGALPRGAPRRDRRRDRRGAGPGARPDRARLCGRGGLGYLVIGWLLSWLRRQSMTVFVVYRVLLALVILATVFLAGVGEEAY